MDKLYYEGIHWYDYLIYAAYNIILSFLILRISDAGFNLPKKARLVLLLQFQVLFSLVILDTIFHFLPSAPDQAVYSSMIQSGQYPQNSPENILPFYYISIFINMISLNSVVIFLFMSFFIFSIAALYLADTAKLLLPEAGEKSQTAFMTLNLFFPAIYLFFTSPSRDPFVLFALSVFIHAIAKYRHTGKVVRLLIWALIVSMLNFKFIPFVLLTLLCLVVLRQSKRVRIYSLSAFVVLVTATIFILDAQGINASWFADVRNETLFDTGNYMYGRVSWSNYGEMFIDECMLILQFLLSPLPVFSSYPLHTAGLFDVVYIILIVGLLIAFARNFKNKYAWLLMVAVLFIICFGSAENDLEHAIRTRIPAIELILILVAIVIQKPVTNK